MQKQIITSLIFFLLFFFEASAQQVVSGHPRQLDAFQLFEIQRGEVELFKTLVYRYEIAWEELDVQSMVDLKDGLAKLMELEVKQAADKGLEERANKEKAYLKKINETIFVEGDSDLGSKAETAKSLFNDFIQMMEADLSEQQAALRPSDKK